MTRSEILDKAKEIVNGQREQDYGAVERNFGLIGQLWTVYLDHLVTAQDVANLMCLFKIARIKTGRGTEDSYIDAAGYMACGGEIATAAKDKHIPAGINNGPFVPSYPPKAGAKCCCTPTAEDIAKMAEDNEWKWELLRAIFGEDFGRGEDDED